MNQTPIRIYHNPRCSKSRATLDLIRSAGHEPQVIEYLKEPLGPDELAEVLKALGQDAQSILRTKDSAYGDSGLDASSTDAEILNAIAAQPSLMERPIVVRGGRAAIGRPPESIQELL